MASFDEFISSIIADGNDGKAFELFCKHFLETAPEYKDQFEKAGSGISGHTSGRTTRGSI